MELRWSCDSRFYETPWPPYTPLISNIRSATLEHLTIESDIGGVNPVVAEINGPNLKSVSLGGLDDNFHNHFDTGDVSSFLKNVPVTELKLLGTYQPLQTLDCLSMVVKLELQLHEDIHCLAFSCWLPNLAKLELSGTTRSLDQFTSRIDALHLTSPRVSFTSGDRKVTSVNETPKSLMRIVQKVEELSLSNLSTNGVLQLPDITASVLLLSSGLKKLRLWGVNLEFLRSKIPFLNLESLVIEESVDFEVNITVPKLEYLTIYCHGLNVVINSVLPALDSLSVFAKSVTIHETNIRSRMDYPNSKLKEKLEIHLRPDAG